MKRYVPILNNYTSRFNDPAGLYLGGRFVKVEQVLERRSEAGKGKCYSCLVAGRRLDIWQDYYLDHWYIEE